MTWIRVACLVLCASLFGAGCTDLASPVSTTAVAGTAVQGLQAGAKTPQTPSNNDVLVTKVLELVNSERTQRGLDPLTISPALTKMAEDYAAEMIKGNFFDHIDPFTKEGPGQRALDHGYIFLAIGENLAGGQSSPEQAMAEWMASTEGHRENILASQWKEIGIGVRTGGQFGVYWVQEFGNPP